MIIYATTKLQNIYINFIASFEIVAILIALSYGIKILSVKTIMFQSAHNLLL
jgi:hypothetical protein